MRLIDLFAELVHLLEDNPRRAHDPSIVDWINAAKARPDAQQLFLHGSRKIFDRFRDPEIWRGQLIFGSKLLGESHPRGIEPYQAEYYGPNLTLVKFHYKKLFRPYSDPVAKEILTRALTDEDTLLGNKTPAWDHEEKIKWGQLDYQDMHRVVPVAVKAGYDCFRIYEVSISAESYGVIHGDMVEIIDRHNQSS